MAHARLPLSSLLALDALSLISTAPGSCAAPAEVDFTGALTATAPCTVAKALSDARRLDWEHPPELDAQDHWFRCVVPALPPASRHVLVCEGLAGLADVWLDDVLVLHAENMFVEERVVLHADVRAGAVLTLCFRALKPRLAARKPRPRWRTRIVEAQQLRYLRTSLLGRTTGFCPAIPVVGPYRSLRIESQTQLAVERAQLTPALVGRSGSLTVELTLSLLADGRAPSRAQLLLEGEAGSGTVDLSIAAADDGRVHVRGTLRLAHVATWWPHTHGPQPLSRARVRLDDTIDVELGTVGFRQLSVDRDSDGLGFGLRINGVPVFCRGACWTSDDLLRAGADERARATLMQVRAAGMNMLRVTGITTYESDFFYALCDELGILVFQDFMFANMDYPIADAGFASEVEREVRDVLARIGARPSLAVLCGGSEVEQQASMLGLPAEQWTSPLFSELLPRLSEELAPGVPYVPSSPSGGTLPFQVSAGVSHYYGVGAYCRPLEDARRSQVRFAAECLAFANVPQTSTIEAFMRDLEAPFHHPRWKQRVPRDRGASWDFEDVRDHYLQRLYGVDPRELRYGDPERYLTLGSAAVGEAMLATYAEWRSKVSCCRGALVFWLKDLWPGAGWGVIDALGSVKSAYYYLARALSPVALLSTDEGLNGLLLHAVNDSATDLPVTLSVALWRAGEALLEEKTTALTLPAREVTAVSVEQLLGRFVDSTYAYRFGPPNHDLVSATLRSGQAELGRVFHFPTGYARPCELDVGLSAQAALRDGQTGVLVKTRKFAQTVTLDIPGYRVSDDWFHLEPHGERWVALTANGDKAGEVRGTVGALNALTRTNIAASSSSGA